MRFDKKGVTILCFIVAVSIGIAFAATEPKPVLYGQAFDGLVPADGATVTVYPQSVPGDTLNDIVGVTGSTELSSWWKVNLANLQTNVQNGNVIVIHLTDGVKETSRTYIVDLSDGAVLINLNLDPAFQDYDNDGYFANEDCNDNDNTIFPGAPELCDGIDSDCDGVEDGCPFMAEFTIYQGWTSFALPYNPAGIDNSEEIGQAIMDYTGLDCTVVMRFDGPTQLMQDDILGLADPSFSLIGTEGYFIHCDGQALFTYGGTLWD